MSRLPIKVAPSILSGDFGSLSMEAKRIEESGADAIHIDIMDGHFAPNFTLGPKGVAAINKATDLFLEVHLMIYNPFDYIEKFASAGADMISFHLEATEDVEDTLEYIRKCNVRACLAVNPETDVSLVYRYLPLCDAIMIMGVNPGFSGQTFIPETCEKILLAREMLDSMTDKKPRDILVDGGINEVTVKECIKAGANFIVSGDYLFHSPSLKKAVAGIKALGEK